MLSPARRHQMRVKAEQAASSTPFGAEVRGSAYELMLRALAEHKRTLKGLQSVERKIAAKRSMLADFDAYLAGALSGGQGGTDAIVTTLMVWHMDTGSWARGLELARYVIQHGMPMPQEYTRTAPTLLIDEAATAALAGTLQGDEALRILADVDQITAEHDAPDQARAKLFKAIGYALIGRTPSVTPDYNAVDESKARAAMGYFTRAHALFAQVGVKKDMEKLERRIKNAAPAS